VVAANVQASRYCVEPPLQFAFLRSPGSQERGRVERRASDGLREGMPIDLVSIGTQKGLLRTFGAGCWKITMGKGVLEANPGLRVHTFAV
jgi:hypothetical protein